VLGALVLSALAACGGGGTSVTEDRGSSTSDWDWTRDAALPAGFPVPAVPEDNPMSVAKVTLGRYLFYDRRLSGNGTQACASCHQQDKAFTDGLAVALGSTGQSHPRNAQSLANVAYNPTLTWANPGLTALERQMEVPLFSTDPVEMGVTEANRGDVLQRLADDADYPTMFAAAFPDDAEPLTWQHVIHAIASFQRTIFSSDSRYDRWLAGTGTLNDQELRGMNLFNGERAECFHCHTGFNFNDQVQHAGSNTISTPFHNTGLYNIGGTGAFPYPNRGVYDLTLDDSDMGKFRAPSLRNVAVTAPYMHDGSIATLAEVLAFYAAGGRVIDSGPYAGDGRANPHKDGLISRIDLSAQDQADLIAFLNALTDETLLSNPDLSDPRASGE